MQADPSAVLGVYRGEVVNVADPNKASRLVLRVPQVLGAAFTDWAEPLNTPLAIPLVHDPVWVQFEGGDISKPLWAAYGATDLLDVLTDLSDTTVPPVPSAATLAAAQNAVLVTWDGRTFDNQIYPAFFQFVEIHRSTAANFTPGPTTLVTRMQGSGIFADYGAGYDQTWHYRLVAVSKALVASAPSTDVSTSSNRVGTGDLDDLSVTSQKVASLLADKISTGTMTATVAMAGTFRTAASGPRWEITASGIRLFKDNTTTATVALLANGNATFSGTVTSSAIVGGTIAGTTVTGSTVIGGTVATDVSPNPRIVLFDNKLIAYTGATTYAVQIFSYADAGGDQQTGIQLGDGSAVNFAGSNTTGTIYKNSAGNNIRGLQFRAGQSITQGAGIALFDNGASNNAGADSGAVRFYTGGDSTAYFGAGGDLFLQAGGYAIDSSPAAHSILAATTANAVGSSLRTADLVRLIDYNGDPWFRVAPDGRLVSPPTYDNTSTSAANLGITSGGSIYRSTSLRKYKLALQDISLADAAQVLELQPKTWFDRTEVQAREPHRTRHAGFVVEDVVELGSVLDTLVTRNAVTGEPDGLAYERIVAYLIPVLRDMRDRLDVLEASPVTTL